MQSTRRSFLKASALGAAGLPLMLNSCRNGPERSGSAAPDYTLLDEALARPVLKRDLFSGPVIIDRLELLRYEGNFMLHFVSTLPNAGPFHEFKGFSRDIPLDGPKSSLSNMHGMVVVPTGPGLGMAIDPDFVSRHRVVEA